MPSPLEKRVLEALRKAIQDPSYTFSIPWLLDDTWEKLATRAQSKRPNRPAIRLISHSPRGLRLRYLPRRILRCDFRLRVLFSSSSSSGASGERRITSKGVGSVTTGLHLFVRGLWQETGSQSKAGPWISAMMGPLIPVFDEAYHSFRPMKKPKTCGAGASYPTELRVIERMLKIQLAKKPRKPKIRKLRPDLVLLDTPSRSISRPRSSGADNESSDDEDTSDEESDLESGDESYSLGTELGIQEAGVHEDGDEENRGSIVRNSSSHIGLSHDDVRYLLADNIGTDSTTLDPERSSSPYQLNENRNTTGSRPRRTRFVYYTEDSAADLVKNGFYLNNLRLFSDTSAACPNP
ncbi:hypothetical protein C8J57DRAFT_1586793 [Mycena rebaudengoi]|nr:hypothetical protein C8J57DRAFT_1586793 [Mycena rebaudengoi]